jgi:colanic acid biosynthesis glycosyl transferase WcaI
VRGQRLDGAELQQRGSDSRATALQKVSTSVKGARSCLYNAAVRILLLNLYFPPDTAATAKVARTIAEALAGEHEVTVVCGRPSYDPTERRPWRVWQSERCGKVRIIRVGSTDYSRVQMNRRIFNYLSYVALAVPRSFFVSCDVILAMTDPPFEGIVGALVALLKRRPFLYHINDLYPDMAVGGAIVEPGMLARIWEGMHRWALRRAACVMVLGEDMRARIAAKGVVGSRIEIVRSGAEIAGKDALAAELDQEVIRVIRGDFKFVLLHAGNLGFYGAWETLIAGARKLAVDGIGLVFVGDGAQKAQLEAAAVGAANVKFLPFFPAEKIPSVLAAGDAHVITVKRGLEGVVVPSKMYGILATGKPIVAVTPRETDVAMMGERMGFSVWVDCEDAEQLAAVARELSRNAQLLQRMGQAARAAAPRFDRGKELEKLAGIVRRFGPKKI